MILFGHRINDHNLATEPRFMGWSLWSMITVWPQNGIGSQLVHGTRIMVWATYSWSCVGQKINDHVWPQNEWSQFSHGTTIMVWPQIPDRGLPLNYDMASAAAVKLKQCGRKTETRYECITHHSRHPLEESAGLAAQPTMTQLIQHPQWGQCSDSMDRAWSIRSAWFRW